MQCLQPEVMHLGMPVSNWAKGQGSVKVGMDSRPQLLQDGGALQVEQGIWVGEPLPRFSWVSILLHLCGCAHPPYHALPPLYP